MTNEDFKSLFSMMSDIDKELCYVASKLHLGGFTGLSEAVNKAKEESRAAAKEISYEAMHRIIGDYE